MGESMDNMRNMPEWAKWTLLLYGVVMSGVFLFGAWWFYRTFISMSGGVVMEGSTTLQSETGRVIKKQQEGGQYKVEFSYAVRGATYYGSLPVGEREFDKTEVGDAIPIFYDVYQPSQWTLRTREWLFWVFAAACAFMLLLILLSVIVAFVNFYDSVRTSPSQ
jgi:hypothetical protein